MTDEIHQGNDLNGKPLEVILGQLGSPASREDVEKFRCLIEDIRRDEQASLVDSKVAGNSLTGEALAEQVINATLCAEPSGACEEKCACSSARSDPIGSRAVRASVRRAMWTTPKRIHHFPCWRLFGMLEAKRTGVCCHLDAL